MDPTSTVARSLLHHKHDGEKEFKRSRRDQAQGVALLEHNPISRELIQSCKNYIIPSE
jgi:hypothetical protein